MPGYYPRTRGLTSAAPGAGSPDLHLISLPHDWDHGEARVAKIPGTHPVCWIGNVGRYGQPAEWYAEAARQFIRHAAKDLAGSAPTTGRPLSLPALH
jgi:hypothetical protein